MGIEGTLSGSDNIDLTNSGLQGISQTSGYLCQSTIEANLKTDRETDEEMIRRDEMSSMSEKEELEQMR